MSWESSQQYYRIINEEIKNRLHGLHSAQCLMFSFDFAEIEELQRRGDWDALAKCLTQAAQLLQRAGADLVLICSNTMHKVAEDVQGGISVPLLHIADATATAIKAQGITRVGLLGTKYTMEEDFYKNRLARFGLESIIPESRADRDTLNDIIFHELCVGVLKEESKEKCLRIVSRLKEREAQGVILGCTELDLLIVQNDFPVPLFDTTRIHAQAAVSMALN